MPIEYIFCVLSPDLHDKLTKKSQIRLIFNIKRI